MTVYQPWIVGEQQCITYFVVEFSVPEGLSSITFQDLHSNKANANATQQIWTRYVKNEYFHTIMLDQSQQWQLCLWQCSLDSHSLQKKDQESLENTRSHFI